MMVDVQPQVFLHGGVEALCLAVRLRVETCAQLWFDVQALA